MKFKALHSKFWIIYIAFVVYGSLVPFEYHPLLMNDAIEKFLKIPMLNLGIQSRADWVANGVLYFPVGFLTFQFFRQFVNVGLVILLSLLFSLGLAVAVEFTQLFFPPRTVSLNDLIAEGIGSCTGIVLATYASRWYSLALESLHFQIGTWQKYLLEGYAFFYFCYSGFPYDFLVSAQEFEQKINGQLWGWLIASDAFGNVLLFLAKLLLEVLMTLPFGILIVRLTRGRATTFSVFLSGLGVGVIIESLQFMTASGVSQGLSVVMRGVGCFLGAKLFCGRMNWTLNYFRFLIRKSIVFISPLYFLVMLWLSGWFSLSLRSSTQALDELTNNTHFLPFYYHYFTTEAQALESLAANSFIYLPVGLLLWAHFLPPMLGGWVAAILAGLIEASKLMLVGKHADPTNLLIAFLASYSLASLLYLFERSSNARNRKQPEEVSSVTPIEARDKSMGGLLAIICLTVFLVVWVFNFPVFSIGLACGFIGYAVLIWLRPKLIFFTIPAALPLLDLASWSGRFFFDEFDVLIIISLVIGFYKSSNSGRSKSLSLAFVLCMFLLVTSYLISVVIGLLPWQAPDVSAFSSYMSNYNSLRIARGVFWFVLLFFLAKRQFQNGIHVENVFRHGLILGLAGTVTFIVVERLFFTGLFDFSSEHRAVGPFSSIHVGGAYVECFLVVSIPFLLKELSQIKQKSLFFLGLSLLLFASYAVMVTFSRGGYLAFAMVLLLFGPSEYARRHGKVEITRSRLIAGSLVFFAILVSVPIMSGQFAQKRLSTIDQDFDIRLKHWKQSLNMMSDDWVTQVFGMGVGKYPVTYYWDNQEEIRSGSYSLLSENERNFIRLDSGYGLHIDQIISISDELPLEITVNARSPLGKGVVLLSICQKWFLSATNCSGQTLVIEPTDKWIQKSITIKPNPSMDVWGGSLVPRYLSFSNSSQVVFDIAEIQVSGQGGQKLLSNASFQSGFDNWFFQADEHLSWHAKNLFLASYFDQGLFGLLIFSTAILLSIRWATKTHQEQWAIALVAFIVVGLFDSLIDAPRFVLLLMILLGFPFILKPVYQRVTS